MKRALGTVALLGACLTACGERAAGPAGGTASNPTSTASSTAAATAAPPTTTTAAVSTAPPTPVTTAGVVRPARAPTTTARSAVTTVPPPTTAPPTTAPSPPPTVAPVTEPFESSVRTIDDAIAARMTASWRPGCPVGLDDLRLVTVSHWGYDGRPRTGELVVRAQYAGAMVGVFERLFRARFPVAQMRLVDEFGADDDRSMAANNTSAFNCRTVAGSTRWSEHAYGGAIDINPIQNPYVTSSGVSPPEGAPYRTRNASTVGLITRDGPVVAAFAAIGWGWGGSWSGGKDYQHFSASGR